MPASRPRDPRLLVHFQPQAVPRAVNERLGQPARGEHLARRRVDGAGGNPGLTAAIAAACAAAHRLENPAEEPLAGPS